MSSLDSDVAEQFVFLKPKLLSQKPKTQVVLCDFYDTKNGFFKQCVLKFFHPSTKDAHAKELAVYSLVPSNPLLEEILAEQLWSGSWSRDKYRQFIGDCLPNFLRKSDKHVLVLAIEYLDDVGPIEGLPEEVPPFVAKAALHALRTLHEAKIVHGDVSSQNLLIIKGVVRYYPYWIDFSSSNVGASPALVAHEWQRAIQYFSELINVDPDSIIPSDKLAPLPSHLVPTQYVPPLPHIPDDMTFSNVSYIAEGTHSIVYKAISKSEGVESTCCLKLFRYNWMTPYNLETAAYAVLKDAGLDYHIPEVHGVGKRTMADWGVDIGYYSDAQYYGLVMEWLEGAEPISSDNISLDHVITLFTGLVKIHEAGVMHRDGLTRNILVFRGSKRAVWIDFSCAAVGERQFAYEQERETVGAVPILILMERERAYAQRILLKYTIFGAMRFPRRASTVLYGMCILSDVLFLVWAFLFPKISGRHIEIEIPVMYLIGCAHFVILMHTHTNTQSVVKGVKWITPFHTFCLLGISLWRFLLSWNACHMVRFLAMSASILLSAKEIPVWSSLGSVEDDSLEGKCRTPEE